MDVISNLPLPATGLKSALPGPTAQPSVSDAPADAYYGSVEGPDPGLYRPFLPSVPRYTADTEKPKGLPAQQAQPPVAGRSRQEIARRAEIMKGMIQEETGIDGKADEKLAAQHQKIIQEAMDAFPLSDLEAMHKDGVKIKFTHPPEGASDEPGGSYVPDNMQWDKPTDPANAKQLKHSGTIYVDPRVADRPGKYEEAVNFARHELAHAKDDFNYPDRLKSVGGGMYKVEDMGSKSGEKVYTDGNRKQWSVQDMYGAFKQNYSRDKKNNYIASKGTDEAHSAKNAQEFYAESYNVFHGKDATEWTRLKRAAPQMYAYLHEQATREGTLPSGIPTP